MRTGLERALSSPGRRPARATGSARAWGAGAVSADRAYLNLGTGLTLGVHAEEYAVSRAYRTLASPIAGAYTLEALLSSGALSIAWFRDHVSGRTGDHRESRLEELAAQVPPGARGLLFLPYLTSAETPHWDALAHEERLSLTAIEASTGVEVAEVVAMGGASRSPLATQLMADVLERPVAVCAEVETTALGAGRRPRAGVPPGRARLRAALPGAARGLPPARGPAPAVGPGAASTLGGCRTAPAGA